MTLQHSMRYKVSLHQQHSVRYTGVSDSAAYMRFMVVSDHQLDDSDKDDGGEVNVMTMMICYRMTPKCYWQRQRSVTSWTLCRNSSNSL